MDLIKEIANIRENSNDYFEERAESLKLLRNFVVNASPYPNDISKEDLELAMRESGAEKFHVIGDMIFAIDDYGTCAAGFRLNLSDLMLKCYNNRMFGIFK